MPSFTDLAGQKWPVQITVGTIRRVQSLCEVNLHEVLDREADLYRRLATDVELLVNVLYAVLKPQLDEAGLNEMGFAERLGGDALDHATRAMLEALVAFIPSPSDRRLVARAAARAAEIHEKGADRVLQRIDSPEVTRRIDEALDQIDRETEAALAAALPAKSKTLSSPAQGGSESTPTRSPSALS